MAVCFLLEETCKSWKPVEWQFFTAEIMDSSGSENLLECSPGYCRYSTWCTFFLTFSKEIHDPKMLRPTVLEIVFLKWRLRGIRSVHSRCPLSASRVHGRGPRPAPHPCPMLPPPPPAFQRSPACSCCCAPVRCWLLTGELFSQKLHYLYPKPFVCFFFGGGEGRKPFFFFFL